jgi:hypothetical protein
MNILEIRFDIDAAPEPCYVNGAKRWVRRVGEKYSNLTDIKVTTSSFDL